MRLFQSMHMLKAAAVAAVLGGLALPARADDLFSRRPLQSAIDAPRQQQQQPQQIAPPQQIPQQRVPQQPPSIPAGKADMATIEGLLNQADYEVKRVDDEVLVIQVKTDKLEIPTVISLSPDQSQLWIVMVLKTFSSVSELSADQLMGLMEASQKYGPAYFSFNRESKRIDLRRAISNLNLDADELKLQLNILSFVATETASLWSGGSLNFDSSQPERAQTPSQPNNQPRLSREVGRWVVELKGGEGFTLQLNADGTFVLDHRKTDGTTDTSRGRYTLSQNTLKLQVSGIPTIEGRVTFSSNDAFKFVIGNGAGLQFKRV